MTDDEDSDNDDEATRGKPEGKDVLPALAQEVASGEGWKNLSKEEKQAMMNEYERTRRVMVKKVKPAAISRDVTVTSKVLKHVVSLLLLVSHFKPHLIIKINCLHLRSGIECMLLIAHGGVTDTFDPVIACTPKMGEAAKVLWNGEPAETLLRLQAYCDAGLAGEFAVVRRDRKSDKQPPSKVLLKPLATRTFLVTSRKASRGSS